MVNDFFVSKVTHGCVSTKSLRFFSFAPLGTSVLEPNLKIRNMNTIGEKDKRIILTNVVNFFYFLISNTPASN